MKYYLFLTNIITIRFPILLYFLLKYYFFPKFNFLIHLSLINVIHFIYLFNFINFRFLIVNFNIIKLFINLFFPVLSFFSHFIIYFFLTRGLTGTFLYLKLIFNFEISYSSIIYLLIPIFLIFFFSF